MSIYPRENFRRGITPNIRMRKDAVGVNNGGVEVGQSNANGAASEPFLKKESSKEDEEEMEKEQKRRKKEVSLLWDHPLSTYRDGLKDGPQVL